MALTRDVQREYSRSAIESAVPRAYPQDAATVIYEGAALMHASGVATPLTGDGAVFVGFATTKSDNTGGADGDKWVNVYRKGEVVLSVTGATSGTLTGAAVYASDDGTFTLTAGSLGKIGEVVRFLGATETVGGASSSIYGRTSTSCLVHFEAAALSV